MLWYSIWDWEMRTAPLDYALYMLAGYCFPANTPFETLALRASVREPPSRGPRRGQFLMLECPSVLSRRPGSKRPTRYWIPGWSGKMTARHASLAFESEVGCFYRSQAILAKSNRAVRKCRTQSCHRTKEEGCRSDLMDAQGTILPATQHSFNQ